MIKKLVVEVANSLNRRLTNRDILKYLDAKLPIRTKCHPCDDWGYYTQQVGEWETMTRYCRVCYGRGKKRVSVRKFLSWWMWDKNILTTFTFAR